MIESQNGLIRQVIREAHQRGIKIRFNLCLTYFDAEVFGGTPYQTFDNSSGVPFPRPIGVYDTDAPGLIERACQVCEEVLEEFPGVDGYIIELEGTGVEVPYRIDLYNQWAKEHGKRPFQEVGHPLNPRGMDAPEWREYTTFSRFKVLRVIEETIRKKSFNGDLLKWCNSPHTRHGPGSSPVPDPGCGPCTYRHFRKHTTYARIGCRHRRHNLRPRSCPNSA